MPKARNRVAVRLIVLLGLAWSPSCSSSLYIDHTVVSAGDASALARLQSAAEHGNAKAEIDLGDSGQHPHLGLCARLLAAHGGATTSSFMVKDRTVATVFMVSLDRGKFLELMTALKVSRGGK